MRHAILALGLALAAAVPAAAQGEIIIRRSGVPDQVISLDTAQARQQVKVLAGQLQKLAIANQQQIREMTAKVAENLEPLRMRTLALADSLRSQLLPMARGFETARRQPHLGIVVRTAADSDDRYGAYIQAVTPGSPAEKAGMMSDDFIVRIAGKSLTEKDGKDDSTPGLRLISIIATLQVGKPVDVQLRRGSQTVNVKVTPSEDTSGAIALQELPSMITNLRRVPGEPATGEMLYRGMPTMPPSNLFSNGDLSFTINGMFGNDLFANLELTALNEKLGSYFGTSQGVLVVSTDAHRGYAIAAPAIVSGMPRDVVIRMRADSAQRSQTRAGATGGAGMMIRRDSTISIDGVPARAGARRTPFTMGLEPGDVILSVDGRKVSSPSQLMRIIGSYDHNDEFKLQIMRQKRQETLPVKMP
jgi:S1-C subfamily serine protease